MVRFSIEKSIFFCIKLSEISSMLDTVMAILCGGGGGGGLLWGFSEQRTAHVQFRAENKDNFISRTQKNTYLQNKNPISL